MSVKNQSHTPSGWRTTTIGSVADILGGATPSTEVASFWGGPIPWCIPTDITGTPGKYLSTTERSITELGLNSSGANQLPPGSLLLCSRATIGEVKIATSTICTNQGFKSLICKESVSNEFLYYVLSTLKSRLVKVATGSTFRELSKQDLANIAIALPPLHEQRAIATALSDVDGLLDSLDAFIGKKRAVKQATMQQLLTGRKRLPGFSGQWMDFRMLDHAELKARIGWQGLTTEEYLSIGDFYLVTGTDFVGGRIDWSNCSFVDHSRFIQDSNIQLRPSDVLLTKDGTIGKVAFVDSPPGPATLNSGVFVIRPKTDNAIPKFLYYVLTSQIFDEFLSQLQAGSTISHLYQKDFVNFTFRVPLKNEQVAIASILTDMDAEIEALERLRNKMEAVKQAMMQELLTGRVRLVEAE